MALTVTGLNLQRRIPNSGAESTEILHDVTCSFKAKQITLLIGKTGSGKSTLLDALAGLQQPTSGEIQLDGKPLWSDGRMDASIHQQIGIGFQAPEQQLFARTVAKEFAYSLRGEKLSRRDLHLRTLTLLEQFGLPGPTLDQSPLHLSQGQKRRVALATIFAQQPEWLLLDEPTAGLDIQGVKEFIQILQQRQQRMSGGIVIATHHLDSFLPIADQVVCLRSGQVLAQMSAAEMMTHPDIWQQADIGVPSAVALRNQLQQQGMAVNLESYSAAQTATAIIDFLNTNNGDLVSQARAPIVHDPEQHSGDIAATTEQRNPAGQRNPTGQHNPAEKYYQGEKNVPINTISNRDQTTGSNPSLHSILGAVISNLDPRAKWLAYVLVSAGILLQIHWLGNVASTVLTVAILLLSPVNARDILRILAPFVLLILLSSVFAALDFSTTAPPWHLWIQGLSWGPGLLTLGRLYRFLLVMILGLILSTTTSQLRMKQGLEQALAGLKRWKLPVEAFSLAASLTLRFIPIIMGELQRFARIAKARGGSRSSRQTIPIRDLPAIVLPLLLSVLNLGDTLSTALEARGYRYVGQPRSESIHLRFTARDWWTCAMALLTLFVLLAIRRI